MLWLILIFVITPAVELALLVKIGDLIGFWPTVGLIFVTGIIGSALTRRQGLSTWRRFQQRIAGGELPGQELVDGVIILVSGALLITPGVVTDLIGFLGLLPWSRLLLRNYLLRRFQKTVVSGARVSFGGGFHGESDDVQQTDPSVWRGTARPQPSHRSDLDAGNEGS